ncbi:ESSS subunit of NADH:ubiquinone oxidoreductase-domain-containing protein [Vararia minispora EC-137]|uniref:ESSS subunit of NADH:ubiquinone oxidoreductase-domain-containing protein n=1 Tax=Vararia minispora EC-137 TaxID=1314806 RepID=A0ACB8QH74_9AGAM|nr:ESSS subunit of NADH:ubiquinone oxidoreductase-domain-containing protein [Vararia minispora EC-137]
MLPQMSARVARTCVPLSFASRRFASGGGQYNEPTGNLFGEPHLAPGQRRKWEWWEPYWYFGIFGGMGLATVGLYYKPDTSIKTWALQEAKSRMEARGEATDYASYKASREAKLVPRPDSA